MIRRILDWCLGVRDRASGLADEIDERAEQIRSAPDELARRWGGLKEQCRDAVGGDDEDALLRLLAD